MTDEPKLRVLTGVPGSGKTSVSSLLGSELDGSWVVLHADDFIGPTFAAWPGEQWPAIRHHHTTPLGQSAGWYMAPLGGGSKNVLAEGHIKDKQELDGLIAGVRQLYAGLFSVAVARLEGRTENIVTNLTNSPHRRHQFGDLKGRERADAFRSWITTWPVEPEVGGTLISIDGKKQREVSLEVAGAFGLA
jgi:hypothetical protein